MAALGHTSSAVLKGWKGDAAESFGGTPTGEGVCPASAALVRKNAGSASGRVVSRHWVWMISKILRAAEALMARGPSGVRRSAFRLETSADRKCAAKLASARSMPFGVARRRRVDRRKMSRTISRSRPLQWLTSRLLIRPPPISPADTAGIEAGLLPPLRGRQRGASWMTRVALFRKHAGMLIDGTFSRE